MADSITGKILLGSGVLAAIIAILGNMWVVHQGNDASLRLEKRKHDADIILQAIDPHDIGKTREMLKFIVDARLIEESAVDLKNLLDEPGNLPTMRGAIACYCRQNVDGECSSEGPARVVGFVEDLPGSYEGRIFKPRGYEGDDLSTSAHFEALCHTKLPDECSDETICWAGGDTGGYYGFE